MANTCPIKSSKSWKQLIEQTEHGGESLAWAIWNKYDGYPPSSIFKSTSKLKAELSIPNKVSALQRSLIGKRLAAYNTRNGTAHSFDAEQIGQSDIYTINFKVNYLSRNQEKYRQRMWQRSENDKSFNDYTDPDSFGLNDRNWEPNAEQKEIITKAKRNGTWLKTPDGKPSLLNAKQWVVARTQEFKDYLGEWATEPAVSEVEMFMAEDEPYSNEMEDESISDEKTEVKPISSSKETRKHNIRQIVNEEKVGLVDNVLMLSLDDFDTFFPEYEWMDNEQKQVVLNKIMSGNIKLTCGL